MATCVETAPVVENETWPNNRETDWKPFPTSTMTKQNTCGIHFTLPVVTNITTEAIDGDADSVSQKMPLLRYVQYPLCFAELVSGASYRRTTIVVTWGEPGLTAYQNILFSGKPINVHLVFTQWPSSPLSWSPSHIDKCCQTGFFLKQATVNLHTLEPKGEVLQVWNF